MAETLSSMWLAWEKYKEFEEYSFFDHSQSVVDFVCEWEARLAGAMAAGCHYSDQVLAFKLLEKANMEDIDVEQLFSCLNAEPQLEASRSLLGQVKTVLLGQPTAEEEDDENSEAVGEEDGEAADEQEAEGNIKKEPPEPENGFLPCLLDVPKRSGRAYICEVCRKPFRSPSSYKQHILIHTGERPYQCPTCPRSFKQKSDLKKHERIHTGEKPYQCEICNKAFAQNNNLHSHRRIHTGEKPYQCDLCERSFIEKTKLVNHRRCHSSERPFLCTGCNRTFAERRQLRRHMERSHV